MKLIRTIPAAIILLLSSICANAQKGIDGMIAAEKKFAAHSVSNGPRTAFLKFLDSSAVMYDKGKQVNALEMWTARAAGSGILNWRPQFAEIATSGDFGYTAGPWTYQPKTVKDSVVARGFFFTVWHMTSSGEWKFLFDLGNDSGPEVVGNSTTKISVPRPATTGDTASLLAAERAFISSLSTKEALAYAEAMSPRSCILFRNDELPAISRDHQVKLLGVTPAQIAYLIGGSGIAPSGDIGYIYGTATANGRTEGYVRVWRKEQSGWKIAMEGLRF